MEQLKYALQGGETMKAPVVQWLELRAFTAVGPGSINCRGTKILQAAQHGQKFLK